jgi:hypothetical protein
MRGSTCKFCHAPVLWREATRYIDEAGDRRNECLPLDPGSGAHNCAAVQRTEEA